MQLYVLVILNSQIVTSALQMRHLHKEALHQSLAYIHIVILGGKLGAGAFQIKTIHDAGKLLTYIVGTLQRTEIDKVLIAPVGILAA